MLLFSFLYLYRADKHLKINNPYFVTVVTVGV